MSFVNEVEIPEEIRNLDLFNKIKNNQTPVRTKDRELYIGKLLKCTANDIKNIMFFGDSKAQSFRKDIESIAAKKQCEKTIGHKCLLPGLSPEVDFTHIDNSRCWLCGYSFMCNDAVDCEHLIPVTFAGLFTGIKSTDRVGDFTEAFIRAYKTNYLYAHASCNRSKSALMLLKWDDDTNKMVFDEDAGIKLQRRILNVAPINNDTQPYADAMLENYRAKMDVICKFINQEYSAFLKNGLSMTDYIKYIVSMTQLYFSKKRIKYLKPDKDRRDSLSEIASNVFSIVKLNEMHTSAKKKQSPKRSSSLKQIDAIRLFSASQPSMRINPINSPTRGTNKSMRSSIKTHSNNPTRGANKRMRSSSINSSNTKRARINSGSSIKSSTLRNK